MDETEPNKNTFKIFIVTQGLYLCEVFSADHVIININGDLELLDKDNHIIIAYAKGIWRTVTKLKKED